MKCSCGKKLKINKKKSILYLLLGKKKRYITCNQCQKTHCIRVIHHIIRDNDDKKLKKLNQYKTLQR